MREITIGQLNQLIKLMRQKRVSQERMTKLLSNGLLADLLDVGARIEDVERDEFRSLLGLGLERTPCDRFEDLLTKSHRGELTDEEIEEYLDHFDRCPSGLHTVESTEETLGLPPGALVEGSPEHGIIGRDAFVEKVLARSRRQGWRESS